MRGDDLRLFGEKAVEPGAGVLRRNEKFEALGGCVNLRQSLDCHSAFFPRADAHMI